MAIRYRSCTSTERRPAWATPVGEFTAAVAATLVVVCGEPVTIAALAFVCAAGVAAARVGAPAKAALSDNERGRFDRRLDATQVLSIAGVAAVCSGAVFLLRTGQVMLTVHVVGDANAGLVHALRITMLASLACVCGDTCASEFGLLRAGDPILVTTCRRVPRGTNGGVTAAGTAFAAFGGAAVGAVAACAHILLSINAFVWRPLWELVAVGAAAGGGGSLVDSILGATMQRTWRHVSSGRIASRLPQGAFVVDSSAAAPSSAPDHAYTVVSGAPLLSNEGVNLASSVHVAVATLYAYACCLPVAA